MSGIINKVKLKIYQMKWRHLNKHNFSIVRSLFDYNLVKVGIGTSGYLDIKSFGNKDENIYIGNYCSFASEVKLFLGGEHDFNKLTTYEFRKYYLKQNSENFTK